MCWTSRQSLPRGHGRTNIYRLGGRIPEVSMHHAVQPVCFPRCKRIYVPYRYDDCGQVNIQSYAKFSAMRDGENTQNWCREILVHASS